MRVCEIICERSKLDAVMAATRRKSGAAQKYQEKLRRIRQKAPCSERGRRDADARRQYQDRMRSADDALRRALGGERGGHQGD
jgi:hypothetical protein